MPELIKNNDEISSKMEKYRKEHGISYTFIGRMINISPSYARRILLNKHPLTENLRNKINKLWQTDF